MTDATASSDSTDPIAIVFPGQGSQAPGMGKLVYDASPAARLTFEEASDVTGMDLAKICFDGSEDFVEFVGLSGHQFDFPAVAGQAFGDCTA